MSRKKNPPKFRFAIVYGQPAIWKWNKHKDDDYLVVPENWLFVSCEYGGMADTQD